MPLTRQERITHHRKAPKTSSGSGSPDNNEGNNGDITFRNVKDSGTVQYYKTNGQWIPVSASGTMPAVRVIKSGGGGGGSDSFTGNIISNHEELSGLNNDDHAHYVHINSVRTITANHAFTGTPTFTNGTFASIDINGGTIDGTAISADSTQTEWDAAHTHISQDGSSHTFIDQSVVSGGAPTFTADNFSDGGSNAIVTTTQETNWDNHLADNSQAHSDYLVNNANDVTSGTLQINGTLALATGSITDSSGAISFGDENLTTTGTVSAEQLTSTDDLTVADQASIDGTMILSEGKITDSTGAITFVDENLSTSGTLASGTQTVTGNVTASGTIEAEHLYSTDDAQIDDNLTVDGIVDITNTTDSSDDSGDTGALRVEGGASIAKKLYVGTDLDVDGISNLDVVDIDGNVQVNNGTTSVVSSGAINLDAGASSRFTSSVGNITIGPKSSFIVESGGDTVILSNHTTGMLYLKEYDADDLWDANHYAINSKAQLNHFTTGYGDLNQNFSILCKQTVPASFEGYLS